MRKRKMVVHPQLEAAFDIAAAQSDQVVVTEVPFCPERSKL